MKAVGSHPISLGRDVENPGDDREIMTYWDSGQSGWRVLKESCRSDENFERINNTTKRRVASLDSTSGYRLVWLDMGLSDRFNLMRTWIDTTNWRCGSSLWTVNTGITTKISNLSNFTGHSSTKRGKCCGCACFATLWGARIHLDHQVSISACGWTGTC